MFVFVIFRFDTAIPNIDDEYTHQPYRKHRHRDFGRRPFSKIIEEETTTATSLKYELLGEEMKAQRHTRSHEGEDPDCGDLFGGYSKQSKQKLQKLLSSNHEEE